MSDGREANRLLARAWLYCESLYNMIEKETSLAARRASHSPKKAPSTRSLIVRLDEESKGYLTRAADLRRINVSDYVRTVTVAQARREVKAAGEQVIALSAEEQIQYFPNEQVL